MPTVTARRIDLYTRCPKRAQFAWESESETSLTYRIISNVIKSVYMYQTRKKRIPAFRSIPGWVDRFLQDEIDINQDAEQQYKLAKNIIARLHIWYSRHYLEHFCDHGLINLPVTIGIGPSTTYYDQVDIVTVGQPVRIFDFAEVRDNIEFRAYNGTRVYNDMRVHTKMWTFAKASGLELGEYVRLVIGPQSIKPVKIRVLDGMLEKQKRYLQHIIQGIQDQVFYPAFSEQCLNCPYSERCSM